MAAQVHVAIGRRKAVEVRAADAGEEQRMREAVAMMLWMRRSSSPCIDVDCMHNRIDVKGSTTHDVVRRQPA